MLMLRPRAQWPALVLVVGLANGLANRLWGDGWLMSFGLVPANLLEIVLGAWLLQRSGLRAPQLRAGLGLLQALLLAGLLPQLAGASLATLLLALLGQGPALPLWLQWFEGSAVGAASMLVLVLLLVDQPWAQSRAALRDPRLWVLAPVTLAVALLCLAHLPFPFVYLGVPLLVAAMTVDLLALALLAWLVSVALALALVGGVFVPPPVTADWQQALVFLACTAALVPPQLLAAAVAELRASNQHLLAGRAELRRANEGLQQFVRIASHDLREPLNTIDQFSGLVLSDHRQHLPPDAARWLQLVHSEARRMRALLDDVLQYAQVRQDELPPPAPVSLDASVADALQALAGRLHATAAVVQVAPLPAVRGHAPLLVLLLQNLLANALKFQPPGQVPQVSVDAVATPGWVLLTVRDNGIGIAEADQARLFKPFQRLHRRRDYEGTGLGLALCQQIAQAHGGSISLQSAPGQGCCFTVRLPAG
ncbi:MAG: histidine kinase [Burkholderiales bacterium PBB5]|nr:MAG: histidine kinase [Burkholderiales bacterium PBB5]